MGKSGLSEQVNTSTRASSGPPTRRHFGVKFGHPRDRTWWLPPGYAHRGESEDGRDRRLYRTRHRHLQENDRFRAASMIAGAMTATSEITSHGL